MEKIASITAALDAGKYPSTEQLNALIEWLTHSVVQPSENNLSGQGRVLANDIRGVLDSYQLLNSNKNRAWPVPNLRFSNLFFRGQFAAGGNLAPH